jgi:hypothetical protein
MTEFGQAIRLNPEVNDRISKLLNIVKFDSIQEATLNLQTVEEDELDV